MPSVLLPFRYAGGKYYAIRILRPFWKAIDHDEYREPMVGGGAVFFAKKKVEFNWTNDIDSDLITTYKIMANSELRKKLVEMLSEEKASGERHKEILALKPRNNLEIAFKYYYLNRTSFSGKMKHPAWGYRPKRSLPPERWRERIIPCGKKLEGVKLTCLDFSEVIASPAQGKSVLMYLDPPYYHAKQESHYSHPFTPEDHIRLARQLKDTEFNFFLTYDDCPEIRELYEWAYIHPIKFFYRIGNSRQSGGRRKKGFELVITNFKIKKIGTPTLDKWVLISEDRNIRDVNKMVHKSAVKPKSKPVMSPFRFPGSKGRAVKYIRPFWERIKHDEYREPFFGGGAVFFTKPKSRFSWINDIDKELMITIKVMANPQTREQLIYRVASEVATKERFMQVKAWKPISDIEIAHRFYYINRTSYSGIMKKPPWGYHPKKSVPPSRWGNRIRKAGEKLQGVKITQYDYTKVIKAPPTGKTVFLFIDPPYYHSDQKRAYKYSFSIKNHYKLCELLKKTPYYFCLTYDDCPEIRNMYSWAKIHPVSWRYHTANARKASRKMGHELIIANYKMLD